MDRKIALSELKALFYITTLTFNNWFFEKIFMQHEKASSLNPLIFEVKSFILQWYKFVNRK